MSIFAAGCLNKSLLTSAIVEIPFTMTGTAFLSLLREESEGEASQIAVKKLQGREQQVGLKAQGTYRIKLTNNLS